MRVRGVVLAVLVGLLVTANAQAMDTVYPPGSSPITKRAVTLQFGPAFLIEHNGLELAAMQGGLSFFRAGRLRLPVLSVGVGGMNLPNDPKGDKTVLLLSASVLLRMDDLDTAHFEWNLAVGYTRNVTGRRNAVTAGFTLGFKTP